MGVLDGKVRFHSQGPIDKRKLAGHTSSPTVVDWDRNGIPDLLVGAEDEHFCSNPSMVRFASDFWIAISVLHCVYAAIASCECCNVFPQHLR